MIAVETQEIESNSQMNSKEKQQTSEEVADDLFENTDVDNEFMADRIVWRMKSLQSKIEDYESTKEHNIEFYDAKIQKLEAQIEYMEGMIKHYMESKELKTLSTPNGTVRTSERTRHIWSDISEKIL